MLRMTSISLDSRPAAYGPFFVSSYVPGESTAWEPTVGDIAHLRSGSISILARITVVKSGRFTGEILTFQDSEDAEFDGLVIGDHLEFAYDEAMGFSR
jgi:hypothetical protein